MNISEDKFANKSADQIVKDVLEQHKQNAQDALTYIQNITADDGLSLSKETKAELKKAEDMLVNRVKRESMVEGIWPFKKKEPEPQKYPAKLLCFPPFKKEPVEVMLPPITSVDDPIVDHYVKLIRAKHPHSPISLRSEAGWKTFFENSIQDYTVKACNKNGKITESRVGNLPIAMALSEKLYESNNYTKIDVIKENKTISSYRGLKEGWLLEDKKTPDEEDFEYNYYKDTEDPNKLNKRKKSYGLSKADMKNSDFWTTMGNKVLNTDLAQTMGQAGLSAVTGIHPSLLGGATHAITDYILNKHNNKAIQQNKLKDLNAKYGIEETENDDKITVDEIQPKDYIDPDKSIGNITKRLLYILSGIHPSLDDTRKPKIQWPEKYIEKCPMPKLNSLVPERYFVLGGFIPSKEIPLNDELFNELSSLVADEEGLNNFKQTYLNPSEDCVVLYPKVPVKQIGVGAAGQPLYQWKVDEDHPISIPVNIFKAFLDAPENNETMTKFRKRHNENLNNLLARDLLVMNDIKGDYPSWEEKYNDIYDLDRFDLTTRFKIYQDWKKANVQSSIHTGKELTKEEIDQKYYYPMVKNELKLGNPSYNMLFNNIQTISKLLASKKSKLKDFENDLNEMLSNIGDDPKENDAIFINNWNEVFIRYLVENTINQLTDDKLYKTEEVLKDTGSERLDEFNKAKDALIDKYITRVNRYGLSLNISKIVNTPDIKNKINQDVNQLYINYTREEDKPVRNDEYFKKFDLKPLQKDIKLSAKEMNKQIEYAIKQCFNDENTYLEWKNSHELKIFNTEQEFYDWKAMHRKEITPNLQVAIGTKYGHTMHYKVYELNKNSKGRFDLIPATVEVREYSFDDNGFDKHNKPFEFQVNTYNKVAHVFKDMEDFNAYMAMLKDKDPQNPYFFDSHTTFTIGDEDYKWGTNGKLELIPKVMSYKNNADYNKFLRNKYSQTSASDEVLKQVTDLLDKYRPASEDESNPIFNMLSQVCDKTGLAKELETNRSRKYKRISQMQGDNDKLNGVYNYLEKAVKLVKSIERSKKDINSDEVKKQLSSFVKNLSKETENNTSSHDKLLQSQSDAALLKWLEED